MPIQVMRLRQAAATPSGDPYYANVVSLLHFDGSNGSTTFTDQKSKSWSALDNAALSTAQKKFGPSSLSLDGLNDGIYTAQSTDFDLPGDFTVEAWVYTNVTGVRKGIISKYSDSLSPGGFALEMSLSGALQIVQQGQAFLVVGTTPVPTDGWHHVAAVRSGAMMYLFLDGVIDATGTPAASFTNVGETTIGCVRENGVTYHSWDGYIDEIRVTKGVARYTANFTPPASPFPDS